MSSHHRPDHYFSNQVGSAEETDLFGKSALLSDADIERILQYKLKLPASNRIAILKLSPHSYWAYNSNLGVAAYQDFTNTLLKSSRVYDASFLPSMLIPETRTIPYLREAAARYQADLLLMYKTSCQSYEKYKLISADQSKVYCTVETALLDVRKGIVPFTSVTSSELKTVENNEDINFDETMRKAQQAALSQAFQETGEKLVNFLNRIRTMN